MTSLQVETNEIYKGHRNVIETWDQSPDPIKSALAKTIKHYAGVEKAISHS